MVKAGKSHILLGKLSIFFDRPQVADELRGRFPDLVLGRISELLRLGIKNKGITSGQWDHHGILMGY